MESQRSHTSSENAPACGGVQPDERFFQRLTAGLNASELALLCGGTISNAAVDSFVDTVGALTTAGASALTYCEDARRHAGELADTQAAAVLVKNGASIPPGARFAAISVEEPKAAFAKLAKTLVSERALSSGPHLHSDAKIGKNVVIEPGVVIGSGVRVGDRARIGANAVLHCGVTIGQDSSIGAGASIQCALVGDQVVIGPNAIIGRPGFGLVNVDGASQEMPQFGRAIIQDRVSIGAGSCVDRGAFGDTIVGEGSKIDNLVHVAHNVVIGRNVVIIACTGISGSVTIGDGAVLAGAVGVADHINIGAGAVLAGRAGVICDIPPGEVWGGYPARPRRQWLKETAWLARAARRRSEA
ncbi:MAG: UDP-3-O-(3-hydroxymyristoyl)glucosamine N-acyltransferase [Caulobacterales bacterium]